MRALLLAVFALAACAQPLAAPHPAQSEPASDAAISGVVSAGIGETADLGEGLTIRPLEVIEDSRCPSDVTCVWAGRLRLRAAISGVSGDSELTLGQPFAAPRGGVLMFVNVTPPAWAEWPEAELGPRPAYRFGFRRE